MAQLGAHPRLAAMMLAASGPGEAALAAESAALLEERDPLRKAGDADVTIRLAAIAHGTAEANRGTLARIREAARQYKRRLGTRADAAGDAGALLAAAFPDRIAQSRGEAGSFRLSGGGGARLGRADRLAEAKLLVVAGLEQKASAQITLAARLDPARLPPGIEAQVTETLEHGFDAASGAVFSRGRRRYDTGPVPTASARAQAFYGMTQTPRLAGGRVRLQLCLLSPAGRPIAVTGDLAGFWSGGWIDARRDMRGRYPKHHWPECPGSEPVTRAR